MKKQDWHSDLGFFDLVRMVMMMLILINNDFGDDEGDYEQEEARLAQLPGIVLFCFGDVSDDDVDID